MEIEEYSRERHCGFGIPVWLDFLSESEINDPEGYKQEIEASNGS